MPPRNVTSGGQAGKEPKKGYDVSTRSPTGKPASVGENGKTSEMFDNPLYGSVTKSHGRSKDQDQQQKDHLIPPDVLFGSSKTADGDTDRPPVPTPRNRSFTCSENKPQPPTPVSLHPPSQKKPVVPSRSEGGMGQSRPPLPAKSRPGVPEPQTPKPRDYRDTSELTSKQRPPGRPDVSKIGRPVK